MRLQRLRRFLSSMAGRLFIVLLSGMMVAAICATALAERRHVREFERHNLARSADRLQGFVNLLDENVELRARLLEIGAISVRRIDEHDGFHTGESDHDLMAVLASRTGPVSHAQVHSVSFRACLSPLPYLGPRGGNSNGASRERERGRSSYEHDTNFTPPRCRLVELNLSDGTPLKLALQYPALARRTGAAFDPWFLSLLALGITILAYIVARIASNPLQRLAAAAIELGQDLQRPPLALSGPLEVRRAAEAFNTMQQRLQRHLSERTQMLAAITHDLQTPLTRLRLRLENVDDDALRERLIADLAAMQALIREGLELARSAETAEQRVALDLDSLLYSITEDACEAGHAVSFAAESGAVLHLRPLAMHRVFSNLVDNAVKYGQRAQIRAEINQAQVQVIIRDDGPGLSTEQCEAVFTPFFRLETSRSRQTGGVGLGLTIARTLAEKEGACLKLRTHPEGGLEAVVHWANPPWSRGEHRSHS